jgi:hypothetical protein
MNKHSALAPIAFSRYSLIDGMLSMKASNGMEAPTRLQVELASAGRLENLGKHRMEQAEEVDIND